MRLRRLIVAALCASLSASTGVPQAAADHLTDPPAAHEWVEGTINWFDIKHFNRWVCDGVGGGGCTRSIVGTHTNPKDVRSDVGRGAILEKTCTFHPSESGVYTTAAGFDCGHNAPPNAGWRFLSDTDNHESEGKDPECEGGSWHGPDPVLPAGATRWTVNGHCGRWVPVLPVVSITGVSVDEDAGIASLTVSASGHSSSKGSVTYSTGDGTAVAGSDYVAQTAVLRVVGGESASVSVSILDDTTACR